mmetsp:Transcript_28725/g.61094  ORF Transcript_28725/g.61094 Transcript_28725/m.61094 type:complete len:95 (-) Transcript_28725:32-316(-)
MIMMFELLVLSLLVILLVLLALQLLVVVVMLVMLVLMLVVMVLVVLVLVVMLWFGLVRFVDNRHLAIPLEVTLGLARGAAVIMVVAVAITIIAV